MWYFFNSRYQGESAMAPQRQRKLGLTRMDAAIDAMLPYGFAKSHVRKIVKRLLKEYGGNEGWPFIEEFAYKQLIEAILRDLGASDETAAENVNPSQLLGANEYVPTIFEVNEEEKLGVPKGWRLSHSRTSYGFGKKKREKEIKLDHCFPVKFDVKKQLIIIDSVLKILLNSHTIDLYLLHVLTRFHIVRSTLLM